MVSDQNCKGNHNEQNTGTAHGCGRSTKNDI